MKHGFTDHTSKHLPSLHALPSCPGIARFCVSTRAFLRFDPLAFRVCVSAFQNCVSGDVSSHSCVSRAGSAFHLRLRIRTCVSAAYPCVSRTQNCVSDSAFRPASVSRLRFVGTLRFCDPRPFETIRCRLMNPLARHGTLVARERCVLRSAAV